MARESLRKSFADIDVPPVYVPPAPASASKAIAERNSDDQAKDASKRPETTDASTNDAKAPSAESANSEPVADVPLGGLAVTDAKTDEKPAEAETSATVPAGDAKAAEKPAGDEPVVVVPEGVVAADAKTDEKPVEDAPAKPIEVEASVKVPAAEVASGSDKDIGQRAGDKPKAGVSDQTGSDKSSVVAHVGRPKIFLTPPVKVLLRIDPEIDNHALDVMSARRKSGNRGMSRNQVYVDWLTVVHLMLDAKDKNAAAQIARKFYCDNHSSATPDDLPAEADEVTQ